MEALIGASSAPWSVKWRAGATPEELMEAIWVAAEMRAGGAYAHSTLMFAALAEEEEKRNRSTP